MTDNATETHAGTKVSWDIFWRGSDGFGEHMQVAADDSKPIIAGRVQLLDWLKSIGAKPLPRDIDFPSKASPARPTNGAAADPMLVAAQQVLGAQISRNCSIHNAPMKRIPAGVSQRTGKPYNAFWVCEVVNGCKGE